MDAPGNRTKDDAKDAEKELTCAQNNKGHAMMRGHRHNRSRHIRRFDVRALQNPAHPSRPKATAMKLATAPAQFRS